MPPLPLRLAAEAPATEVLGPSFCLQAPDDEQGVCIIADSAGIDGRSRGRLPNLLLFGYLIRVLEERLLPDPTIS